MLYAKKTETNWTSEILLISYSSVPLVRRAFCDREIYHIQNDLSKLEMIVYVKKDLISMISD